jgi:hypothetical protein
VSAAVVRHEDGGYYRRRDALETLACGLSSRDTGFNPGQRDAIVSLTAAAIGVFAFPIPFLKWSTVWMQTCLWWCGVGWRGGRAHLSRYPVTCSLSESCVSVFGQSSLVLVCFWSATHRLEAGMGAHCSTCHVGCQCRDIGRIFV